MPKTPRRRQRVVVPADQAPPERKISAIFEFKITLRGVIPNIWRRVQVPKEFNFQELHYTIQAVMGWRCCHAYTFHVPDPANKREEIDITCRPTYECLKDTMPCFPSDEKNIAEYFMKKGDSAVYEYDHGDSWEHDVVLEKILLVGPRSEYPKAVSGKRACPPEDSGGSGGYKNLLKAVKDPKNVQHEELKDFLDDYDSNFDPEHFDPGDVSFDRYKLTCVVKKAEK